MSSKKAYLSAILYSLIIGLSFLFVKVAIPYGSPILILAHRFTVAFVFFTIYIKITNKRISIEAMELVKFIPMALFYPTAFFSFQTFGLTYVSSAESGIIFATVPIFTLVLARLFIKEITSFIQKLSMGISVGGVAFIFIMKGAQFEISNMFGILLLFISVISLSSYNVAARQKLKDRSFMEISYILTAFGFIIFNFIYFFSNIGNINFYEYLVPFKSISYTFSILYLGLFASGLSLIFSTYSLSVLSASKMSVFSNFATLISILAGIIILKEQLYYYHFIGAFFIIIGILGANIENLISNIRPISFRSSDKTN